jgi:superfamily II DNA/RNA helicase
MPLTAMTFAELLSPDLVAALAKQQIDEPTPIQTAAIPTLREGKSAYLRAETGTGKTLAYLLPAMERLDAGLAATQVIVAAPTHELAIQIHRQSCELAVNAGRSIRSVLLIGGTAIDRQIDKLKGKPQIVVGSPGRINELIGRGKLKAAQVRTIVIDEADRLLHDESIESIRKITKAAPLDAQRIFVSATIEAQTREALSTLAPDAEMIEAASSAVNADIEHLYLICEERDKPDVLRKLVHAMEVERAIVFVHRNDVAERVVSRLAYHSIAAADLFAALDKLERKRAMDGIRSGAIRVLIASDLAARGIDIGGVSHVFNLDAPTLSQAYLHRVGRTGRAGAKGIAVSLFTETEARLVRRYETELGIAMRQVRVREGRIHEVRRATR